MESRLLPDPLVVPGRGEEHAALTLGPHPGPRLGFGDVVILLRDFAHHQYRAVFLVVVLVLVGLIPSLERLHAGHRRVLGIHHLGGEGSGLVAVETAAHQLVEARLVAETPARTMHRHEASAAFDVALQVLPLLRGDLPMVRIQQHRIKLAQIRRVTERLLDAGHVIKVDRILPEPLRQHRVILVAVVVLALVAEEQHADRAFLRLGVDFGFGQNSQRDKDGDSGGQWDGYES